jgi:uncharacterized protein (TIGR03067 family)
MRKFVPLLLAAVLSLAFAPAPLPRPDAGKDDLKKMQGTWDVVSRTSAGRPLPATLKKVVIAGDRLTFYRENGTVATRWVLKVDDKKSPRQFSRHREGPAKITAQGIYELKGDTLTMCYTRGNNPPPADLDGNKPGRWHDVYRRGKR